MALNLEILLKLLGTDRAATDLNGVADSVKRVGNESKNASDQMASGTSAIAEQLERMQKFALGFIAFEKLTEYASKTIELADSWTNLNAKMVLATGNAAAAKEVTAQLFDVAQNLRVPLDETAKLFGRLVPALKEFGGGTNEAMRLTQELSMSLKLSGATTAEAGAAMLQFSQAMSAGALRGEEFNSMADAAPRFLKALSDGMGVSRGALKSLAEQGKLTTDVVYDALSKQLPVLKDEFGKLPLTVGDAWTKMGNAAMKAVGETDTAAGGTHHLALALEAVANNLPMLIDGVIRITEVTLAYFAVVKGGPMLMEALALAQGALTYSLATLGLAMELSTNKWELFTTNLSNSKGVFAECATGLGALKVAGSLMMAAFVGWEIGSWLSENFVEARIAGIAFVNAMLQGWEYIKYAAEVAFLTIKAAWDAQHGDFSGITNFTQKLGELSAAHEKELKLISSTTDAMIEDEVARTNATNATKNQTEASDKLNNTANQTAKQAKDMHDAYDRFTKKLIEHTDELKDTIAGHAHLTETQKVAIQVSEFLNSSGQKLTQTEKDKLQSLIASANGLESQSAAMLVADGKYKSLTSSIESQITRLKEQAAGHDKLTESQKLTIAATDLLAKSGNNLTTAQRALLEQLIGTMTGLQSQTDAEEKATKAREEHTKKVEEGLRTLQTSLEKAVEEQYTIGKTAAQVRQLELARDRETLATLNATQAREGCSQALDADIEAMKKRISLEEQLDTQLTTNEGLKKQQDQIKANTESWTKFADDIGKDFTDGFQRMLENGKSGWDSFTSSIRNTFQKELVQWLYSAFAKPIVVSMVAGFSGGASAGTTTGASGLSSLMNLFGGGSGGGITGSVGSGLMSLGNMVGSTSILGFGAGMNAGAGAAGTAAGYGSMAGSVLSVAGPVAAYLAAGTALYKGISGEFSTGNTGKIIGLLTGGIGGGLFNRAFGMGEKKVSSFGVEGTFSGSDFNGQNYANWKQKGGWFKSDKKGTNYSSLDSSMESTFDDGFSALKQSLAGYATSLGLATTTITGYSKQIKLELTDDAASNTQKITDLFSSMGDEMANGLIPNMADFALQGETSATTLQRLAGVFDATNAAASLLGANFETAFSGIGLSSAKARQSLIDLSGGLEAFSQKVAFYYDNFYSDQEKGARSFAELDAKLDKLGISVDLTKDAFRAKMEDVNITQNPEQYAALLDLAPLFTQVLQNLGDSAAGKKIGVGVDATGLSDKQLADINQSADSWFSTYQPQIQAQTDQAAATTDAIVNLTNVSATASEAVRAAIADGNSQLAQILAAIGASGMSAEAQGRAIAAAIASMGKTTVSAVETAVASGQRN